MRASADREQRRRKHNDPRAPHTLQPGLDAVKQPDQSAAVTQRNAQAHAACVFEVIRPFKGRRQPGTLVHIAWSITCSSIQVLLLSADVPHAGEVEEPATPRRSRSRSPDQADVQHADILGHVDQLKHAGQPSRPLMQPACKLFSAASFCIWCTFWWTVLCSASWWANLNVHSVCHHSILCPYDLAAWRWT